MNMYLYFHEINLLFQRLISNDSFRQFTDFRLSPQGDARVCAMHTHKLAYSRQSIELINE